ncbi:MAG: PatB family C-S lyase [Candidatus Cloacimonetes bacterium]|nr:PatB family C-S lyase [Candidatus Cloacimonadota bacterium]
MDFNRIIERAGTNCYKWDTRTEVFGNDDVTPLSVADMDLPCAPGIVRALRTRGNHPIYGYAIYPDSYHQAAIDWFNRRLGWQVERKWLLNTPGVVPALAFAVQAFSRPGEGVLIQTPVYRPFFQVIRMNDREVVANPLALHNGHYEIDFDDLERKLSRPDVHLMFLCSPHNPVGRVWRQEELLRLAELCLRHGVVIFSDDIHGDIIYPGSRHIPLDKLDTGVSLLTAVAPGKTFNIAGLATAMLVVADDELRDRYRDAQYRCGLWMGNVFGIEALEAAYTEGEAWLEELLVYLRGNLDLLCRWFPGKAPGIRLIEPQGTYVAWLDCRELRLPQDDLVRLFVERAHVGLDNGVNFGTDGEGFMRINFALPTPRLREALERITAAVNRG